MLLTLISSIDKIFGNEIESWYNFVQFIGIDTVGDSAISQSNNSQDDLFKIIWDCEMDFWEQYGGGFNAEQLSY